MKESIQKWSNKAQATTELAIMGTVVIMVLGFLLQQGFVYNSRQAVEMYTFRQALKLSREKEKGITLTVARDVFVPSFFSGLSRQRVIATSSVDYNPYILHTHYEEDPEDMSRLQLIQIGDAMIYRGSFLQVPPTKVKIKRQDSNEPAQWMWVDSGVKGFSTEGEWATQEANYRKYFDKSSNYNSSTQVKENKNNKTVTKTLESSDIMPWGMDFETKESIIKGYKDNDWKKEIEDVEVDASTIPRNIGFILEERVRREKSVTTPHQ